MLKQKIINIAVNSELVYASGKKLGSAWDGVDLTPYLEAFSKALIEEFIKEVNYFQDETGSNSQDEAFGNAQMNLFGYEE